MPFWKRKDIKREYKNLNQYHRICVYGGSDSMVIEIGELLHDVLSGVVLLFPGAYCVGKFLDMMSKS